AGLAAHGALREDGPMLQLLPRRAVAVAGGPPTAADSTAPGWRHGAADRRAAPRATRATARRSSVPAPGPRRRAARRQGRSATSGGTTRGASRRRSGRARAGRGTAGG